VTSRVTRQRPRATHTEDIWPIKRHERSRCHLVHLQVTGTDQLAEDEEQAVYCSQASSSLSCNAVRSLFTPEWVGGVGRQHYHPTSEGMRPNGGCDPCAGA
jgi:hypothetical protein